MLRKGVYPYECRDSWNKFDETSLPNKEALYSSLNVEDITDVDYRQAKRVFNHFNNKTYKRLSGFVCSECYIITCRCI